VRCCASEYPRSRETPTDDLEVPVLVPAPEEAIDQLAMRDWVWERVNGGD